jgi:hypothetical protein
MIVIIVEPRLVAAVLVILELLSNIHQIGRLSPKMVVPMFEPFLFLTALVILRTLLHVYHQGGC